MRKLLMDIERFGGLASWGELMALGHRRDWVEIAAMYGTLIRVRKGWYALPDEADAVVRAWRVGGRLTCASALAHLAGQPATAALHVEVPANTPRFRSPESHRRPLSADEGVVIHWTRRPHGGDRRAAAAEEATRLAQRCAIARAASSERTQAASSECASRIV